MNRALVPEKTNAAFREILDALAEADGYRTGIAFRDFRTPLLEGRVDDIPGLLIASARWRCLGWIGRLVAAARGSAERTWVLGDQVRQLQTYLLKRKLSWTEPQLRLFLEIWRAAGESRREAVPPRALMRHLEILHASNGLPESCQKILREAVLIRFPLSDQDREDVWRRRDALAARQAVEPGKGWSPKLKHYVSLIPAQERRAWIDLFTHFKPRPGSRPGKAWLAEAKPLVEAIGADAYPDQIAAWDRPPDGHRAGARLEDMGWNSDIGRQLIWCLVHATPRRSVPVAAALAGEHLRYITLYPKLGVSAAHVLGMIATDEAVVEIIRLQSKLKGHARQKALKSALEIAADARGISVLQVADRAVPDFGLAAGGWRRFEFGDHAAEVQLEADAVTASWVQPGGKSQRTLPKALKDADPGAGRQVTAFKKRLKSELAVQRQRVERLMLVDPAWELSDWRSCYLGQPLLRNLACRLIWTFGDGADAFAGMPDVDGRSIRDAAGRGRKADPGEIVRLWHPVERDAGEVLEWRDTLMRRTIIQPFKQAFREIYVLTDAERETGNYSNRFAAHFLRQHTLAGVAKSRGWKCPIYGAIDTESMPEFHLPAGPDRVEYYVEAVDEGPDEPDYLSEFVTTDRVVFRDRRRGPIDLEAVGPRIFSEMMRDVDLFVSIASVGIDPEWSDRDRFPRIGDYWDDFARGDLGPMAETRRDVLSRILPNLAAADRFVLEDRHLLVRGNSNTYRIHLGSGHVFVTPADRYICIVLKPQRFSKIFLPFEGDTTLSMILSKALLLVDDDSIADPQIRSQIGL